MAKDNQEFHYPYWSLPTAALLQEFYNNNATTEQKKAYEQSGLSSEEANIRL
jgi:hypothetical protein